MTDQSTSFDYDVALSFAGEDRPYVHDIAERLRNRGVRVFFDQFAVADIWGAELTELLDEVYRKKARFTIAFISSSYVTKSWPTHERRSALARALTELGPNFLPIRLDNTKLPGLRPTVGYVDAESTTPDELVELILQKLGRPIRFDVVSRFVDLPIHQIREFIDYFVSQCELIPEKLANAGDTPTQYVIRA